MKVLLIGKGAESLTGAGTYEAILLRELRKRHEITIYTEGMSLDGDWDIAHCTDLKHLHKDLPPRIKCPLVVDIHDYYWVNYYHFLCLDFPVRFILQQVRRRKYLEMFKHIDGVVVRSEFMRKVIPHHNTYLNFHYGPDYPNIEERQWGDREELIFFVGGDYFRKGLPRLLKALPQVVKEVPSAKLIVIGREPWYSRQFAKWLGRGLPIELIPGLPRDEVMNLYGKGKVLVLPSEIEALSLVSAECTMAGTPPILTAVGGMPEVVKDGETGYLVPLDDAALLAKRIVQCLTDRELSERLVSNGREFFAQFTPERMVLQMEGVYEDLLSTSDAVS